MEVPNSSEIPPAEGAIQHLLETEVEEIDPYDPRLGFLTPTSIEMVSKMNFTGRLHNLDEDSSFNDEGVDGIALPGLEATSFVIPRNQMVNELLSDPDEAREYTSVRARRLAGMHYFLDQFGMPFDNPLLSQAVSNYLYHTDPESQELRNELTGTDEYSIREEIGSSSELLPFLPQDALERVPLVAEEALKRKGIVIGVAVPSATDSFRILGPSAPEDFLIKFSFGSNGLPFKKIGVNSPQGEHEKAFYASLRKGNMPPKRT